MGKMPAEAYLDKLLSSVDDQLKREKFKEKIFAWLLKKRAVRLILALI